MNIHIISTVNGEENEGMRNIAAHLGNEFAKEHTVLYSSLRDIPGIIQRTRSCDVTLIIARAVGKIYWICRIVQLFTQNFFLVLVQSPSEVFIARCNAMPLRCSYFSLNRADAKKLPLYPAKQIFDLTVGIDANKFTPADKALISQLKGKYGFDAKPVVLHVGHLSVGRGLEDFLRLDPRKYNLLVVASGMFENEQIEKKLLSHNVRLIKDYLPQINEIYQLADAYLFPTKSTEFVINTPLSIMESLSSGTCVVAYRSFEKTINAGFSYTGGLLFADCSDDIPTLTERAVGMKSEKSYLTDVKTWTETAVDMLRIFECLKEGTMI